ncbi:MAG: hypothetical protein R2736_06925 [Solirubrobacterales bacterium]
MSRNAASLFGAGDLDELALYTTALSATTIAAHYSAGTGQAPATTLTARQMQADATSDDRPGVRSGARRAPDGRAGGGAQPGGGR